MLSVFDFHRIDEFSLTHVLRFLTSTMGKVNDFSARYIKPNAEHWFGTDSNGANSS